MSRPTPLLPSSREETYRLAGAVLAGEISDAAAQRFEQLVTHDPAACDWYVEFMCDAYNLRNYPRPGCESIAQLPVTNIPPAAPPIVGFPGNALRGSVSYFSQVGPLSYLIAMFIMLGMGVVAWQWKLPGYTSGDGPNFHISENGTAPFVTAERLGKSEPSMAFVGRITGMVDCEWSDPNTVAFNGASVPLNRKYALASGLMEITYNTGAKVILQGPVTYEVESNDGGYLSLGKLTARVEKNEERRTKNEELSGSRSSFLIPHSYFTVRTPTATVTDLGTEFGVEVSKEGNTTSHVFRGSVEVQAMAGDGKAEGVAQVLHENQSARVEKHSGIQGGGNGLTVLATPVKLADFVREIPNRSIKILDLVDVVAGGNGSSGRRNRGIDATNGRITNALPPPNDANFLFSGDGKYHRVEELPFVDGVFIPDGRNGQVQINSVGPAFDGFPKTTNRTSGYLWAGGVIPVAAILNLPGVPATLNGIDYSSPGHGLLLLHANKGITFDLDAMRQKNPGCKPMRFRAVVGNTELGSDRSAPTYADIWVLVDAKVRFQRQQINFGHVYEIVVPLDDKARFLTLAATESIDDIGMDWIIFGDPQIELLSTSVDRPQDAAAN